jgi:hypothetical protein
MLDQTMAVEHGMHRAFGRNADIAVELADQQLAYLPGAPVRLVLLGSHDHALDRVGQLVGISHRPTSPIGERLKAFILVAVEDLVAGLA